MLWIKIKWFLTGVISLILFIIIMDWASIYWPKAYVYPVTPSALRVEV